MALDASNFAANLKTAKTVVSQRLGVDPLDMTYEQETAYNIALAQYISQYPASFDPSVLDIARRILNQPAYQPLSDPSLNLGDFVDAAIANADAINPLSTQNIGTVGKWLLGAAVVVVLGYLAVRLFLNRPARE